MLFRSYAFRLVKSWDKVTLNELHIATICYAYSAKTGYLSVTANRNTYISRRRSTYGVVSGLGWTYCNTGDYRIPYNSIWASGAAWLQNALNIYQKAGLTVDGSYGPATQDAVKKFQESAGLTADGYAGLETSSMLIYKMYYNMAVNGASGPDTISPIEPENTTDIVYDSKTKQWRYCCLLYTSRCV